MTDVPIRVKVSSTEAEAGSKKAVRSLDDIKRKSRETKSAVREVDGSFKSVAGTVRNLIPLMGGLSAAFAVRELIKYSDTWKSLEGRLTLVTDTTKELIKTQEDLYKISQETRGSFQESTNLYVKLAQASEELGTNQQELLRFTELVNKSFVISGAATSEVSAATRQLSQALASGVLRGDEFNSIMENAPRLQAALSKSLGVTKGELRELASEGALTANEVYRAILSQGQVFDEEFRKIPLTVSQSLQQVENAFLKFIGQNQVISEGTGALASSIQLLAENFDVLASAVQVLAVIYGTKFLLGLTQSTGATIAQTLATVRASSATVAHAEAEVFRTRAIAAANLGLSTNASAASVAATANLTAARATTAAATAARVSTAAFATLAGPLGIGAVIAAYMFLNGEFSVFGFQVDKSISIIDSLKASLLGLGGLLLKLGNYSTIPARTIVNSFASAFKNIAVIFTAFKKDLVEFFQNPLEGTTLANTRSAVANAFKENTIGAFNEALADVRAGNKEIDGIINDTLVEYKRKNDQAKNSSSELEDEIARLREEAKRLSEQMDKAGSSTKAANDNLKKTKSSAKEAADGISDLQNIINRAGERVFDSFVDGFRDMLDGSIDGFKSFGDTLLNVFKDTIANMLALSIANPIIIPIIQSAGGTAGGGIPGISGGGGGDLFSNIKQGYDLFSNGLTQSVFGRETLNAVNSFGLESLGIGQTLPFQGPLQPGAAGLGSGQLGTLGNYVNPLNIGAGFAGSLAAGALFGEGIGTSVGSGLGGLGAGLGAAALGLGPVGAAALIFGGSFLGGGLGSLFNSKPSSKLQSSGIDLDTGEILGFGGLTGKKFDQGNQDASKAVSETAARLSQLFGVSGKQLSVAVGNRDGIEYSFDASFDEIARADTLTQDLRDTIKNGFTGPNSAIRSIAEDFASFAGDDIPELLKVALENIDFGTTEKELATALEDLEFAANFDKLLNPVEDTATQYTKAIQAINDQWDTAIERAERLGFAQETLAEAERMREESIESVRQSLVQSAVNDFLSVTSPGALKAGALSNSYQLQKKEFESAGLDTSIIDKTYQIRQEELYQQIVRDTYKDRLDALEDESKSAQKLVDDYSKLSKSLEDSILSLRLSDISPIGKDQQLSEARSAFLNTASRARLGDKDAISELSSLGNTFLSLSRDYYASTDQFVSDFNLVEEALRETKTVADRQVTIQESLLKSSNSEIAAIQQQTRDLLEGLSMSSTKTASIINSSLQVSGKNANEILVNSIRSGQYDFNSNKSTIDSLFASVGAPAADNQGGRSTFLENNPASNAAFIQAAKQLGIPGFNLGGDVLANSLFMVGERKPELYMSGNKGGKVVALQNGENIENRLQSLEKEMSATNRILRSGFSKMIEGQQDQVQAVRSNERVIKRVNK